MKASISLVRKNSNLKAPDYAYIGDAGFDLCANQSGTIQIDKVVEIPTGLILLNMDSDSASLVIEIRPRSGLSSRGLLVREDLLDCSNVAEEIYITIANKTKEIFNYSVGDRLAQAVVTAASKISVEEKM